ncbi:MAG: peptide ABC transporter substrate-binding protein [Verrucomicrobia bacterium]|nr:peptide ABC transporter substrate-binding protein [Verrucomicrobiota bacterium]
MKSVVLRLSLCLAGLTVFIACKPRETAVEAGVRDQVLHIASGAEPQSLDPHIVTGTVEMRILQNLFEGLVAMDPVSLKMVPAAAESWNISEDGKTYTFHLRKNLKWSNGDRVTAFDFHYAMRRVLSPKLGNTYIEYFFQTVTNAIAYNSGEITDFGEVGFSSPNDFTFEIHLDHPNPVLLNYLDQPSFYPMHKHTVEAHGDYDERGTAWMRPENFVGNGAFQLTKWGVNTVVSMEPNPHYWDRDTVRLNQVHFHPIENTETQYRAYESGQVHVALHIPLHVIMQLEKTLPPDYHNHMIFAIYFYVFNVNKPPLDDPRIRKALSMAINRKDIVEKVTQGGEQVAFSYVPPKANNYVPTASVSEDLDEARRLLAEAGYPGGEGLPTLELIYNTADNHKKIAEAIQQMWKSELGVNIELINMEWKVFLDTRSSGDFQIARSGWGSDTDYGGYMSLFTSDSGNNPTGWSNRIFDQLYQLSTVAIEPSERMKIIQEAEAILLDELPVMPIYFYTRNYLVDPRLKNWPDTPTDMRELKYMYFEE